jgi:hypothetical protein
MANIAIIKTALLLDDFIVEDPDGMAVSFHDSQSGMQYF